MFRVKISIAVLTRALLQFSCESPTGMPVLTEVRRNAIDAVRESHRLPQGERYEAERARLEIFFNNTEELLNLPDAVSERLAFELAKPPHIRAINEAYVDHDAAFKTGVMDPWLFSQLLQESDYLDYSKRELIFGKRGYMIKGFPVDGELPRYGAWDGRPLSGEEQARCEALVNGDRDFEKMTRRHVKVARGPLGEPDPEVRRRGFEAVCDLLDGVIAYEKAEEDLDLTKFVIPIFSIGQKLQWDGHCAKQAKSDICDSVTRGREEKKKGKLAWTQVENLPLPVPPAADGGFVPTVGKIDLFRAYMQCGVKNPENNQFQVTKIEQLGELAPPPNKRGKVEPVVPKELAKEWPLREHSVITLWPDEDFFLRNNGLASRNAKWKAWMFYCKNHLKKAFFEVDKYQNREQAEFLREHHPNIMRSEVQQFGIFLLDCDYKNPEHYVSLVGQRLRSINALERGNMMAHALMNQTINRLKRLGVEWSKHGAFPPDLTACEHLSNRHKMIFEFWMATGLRPKSLQSIRADLAYRQCGSQEDLVKITKTLNTSLYGPRRALAIYLRLRTCELGVKAILPGGKANPTFLAMKAEVNRWMGWSKTSNMWETVYAVDAWDWKHTGFQIHPLVRSYFDSVALRRTAPIVKQPAVKPPCSKKKAKAAPKRKSNKKNA
eukprot:g17599.t1